MKVMITGSRDWSDKILVREALVNLYVEAESPIILIHGAAEGADTIAEMEGKKLGFRIFAWPAHWRHTAECPNRCKEVIGRPAGVIRNGHMLSLTPDLVIAFHDDIENSKGTRNAMDQAKKFGIPIRFYSHE